MKLIRLAVLLLLFMSLELAGASDYSDINSAPHNYKERTPRDRFSRLIPRFEKGDLQLNTATELTFLTNLLEVLEVPVSSQMLVFSTTSLQLGLISPNNPRAIYFNEDTYVGFIPRGKIEIVSIDPELGAIFYIFDVPRTGSPKPERSGRCMNCHSGEDTGWVPGVVIKSVIPGPGGGSLTAFRTSLTGHEIPYADRFGGWYLTGANGWTNHYGNLTGRLSAGLLTTSRIVPGELYPPARYPREGSDFLPQLIHEHQAGFVNRIAEAAYRARTALHDGGGELTAQSREELEKHTERIVRYLFFSDEPRFPISPHAGDSQYKSDFLEGRKRGPGGRSLRDLDLHERIFALRCSYMVYSEQFASLPPVILDPILNRMKNALEVGRVDPATALMKNDEKALIASILKTTLPIWERVSSP